MILRLTIMALICLMALPLRGQVGSECASALKTLFESKVKKDQAADFLRLQGDLTLHRLAWAYLKTQKNDDGTKLENVERTILTLLDEKYTSTDSNFKKARDTFESQPLSRTTLAEIAPFLKDILSKDFAATDKPFVLNASDLKLLHSVARFEKRNAINGIYKSSMLDSNSPEGMLNFVKLINASYKTSTTPNEEILNVEMRLKGLENTLVSMQQKLNLFFKDIHLPTQCDDLKICDQDEFSEIFNQSEELQKIFWSTLEDKLLSDDLILDELTYGELWLKTGPSLTTPSSSSQQRQTVIGQKVKASPVSPVTKYYTSNTGMFIEDPVQLILKDGVNRKAENWRSFEPEFLQSMSDAILADEKVFIHHDKIYDRKTGRYLKPDSALDLIPPTARAEFKKNTAVVRSQACGQTNYGKS